MAYSNPKYAKSKSSQIQPVGEAYVRAAKSLKHYRNHHWVKEWWEHKIEAQTVIIVGFSIMRLETDYSRQRYFEEYIKLANLYRAGGRIDIPDPDELDGFVPFAKQVENFKSLMAMLRSQNR